jgi:hypothetical protein
VKPLRSAVGKSNEIIAKPDIDAIFSSIDVIHAYNCQLRNDLENRLSDWDPNTSLLGDLMLNMVGCMRPSVVRSSMSRCVPLS